MILFMVGGGRGGEIEGWGENKGRNDNGVQIPKN